MKLKLVSVALISAFCISFSTMVLADGNCVLEGNAVPISQIEKSVQDTGSTIVRGIKLIDSCVYKVKVKDKAGQMWKLYFDPLTGKLIGKKTD